jgi:hypothetical protein
VRVGLQALAAQVPTARDTHILMPTVQARGWRQGHEGAKAGQHGGSLALKEAPTPTREQGVPTEEAGRGVCLWREVVANVALGVAGRVQGCEGHAPHLKHLPVLQQQCGALYPALLQGATSDGEAWARSSQSSIAATVVPVVVSGQGAAQLQGGWQGCQALGCLCRVHQHHSPVRCVLNLPAVIVREARHSMHCHRRAHPTTCAKEVARKLAYFCRCGLD